MSGLSGFSKVNVVDEEDEDEERRRHIKDASALYRKAQEEYFARGAKEEALKLFESAEAAMRPILGGGLTALAAPELEMVLRGRLHQAVILAHLEGVADKWKRVKGLAEDILQYDFGNAHARWLRGLALEKGLGRSKEAEEEMRRAVECARSQGKAGEADNWEAEIRRSFEEGAEEELEELEEEDAGDDDDADGAGVPWSGPIVEEIDESPPVEEPKVPAQPVVRGEAPALKKGFFDRKSPKSAEGPPKAQKASQLAPGPDAVGEKARKAELEKARQDLEREHRLKLEKAGRELAEERRRREELEETLREWQLTLQEGLDVVAEEAEVALRLALGKGPSDGALQGLRDAAQAASEQFEAGRTWAESEHQGFLTLAMEVDTLREMTTRELSERKEASKQQATELREIARRMGELKTAAKTLRDHMRAQEDEVPDLQRLAERAAEFRKLPAKVKLAALADDAAVLKLLLLAFFLGILLALGSFVEGFGAFRCRFVCAR